MKKLLVSIFGVIFIFSAYLVLTRMTPPPPIKVGVLHSLTGTMAISEKPVVDATLLAIELINRQAGVLGRKIEPVVADGKSDPGQFAKEAQRLIDKEKVVVIFGCWTSASRKEVKEVVESAGHLLIYPVQYEGVENSPCIVYTGSVPNQQIKPAVKWALDNTGNRFFLIGSDYIFPRVVNAIIRDLAGFLGAEVVGERYVPLGNIDFGKITAEIAETRPAVVFNTLNGDSNLAFFAALYKHGITAADIPVFSFSIGEAELKSMLSRLEIEALVGHYAAWSYFQTLPGEANRKFLSLFAKRYGAERRVTDPMVTAYNGVWLWAQTVKEIDNLEPGKVHRFIARQSYNGPGGIIYIDNENRHAWKPARIGRINDQGFFDIIWDSQKPIYPEPFPSYVDRKRWQDLEKKLYEQWGNNWENIKGIKQ